jgi:hypothetical protein
LQYILEEAREDLYAMEVLLQSGAVMPPDALTMAVNSYGFDQENSAKVEAVISHGAAIVSSAESDGFTALHCSALNGSLKVMESIVRRHPDGRAEIHSNDSTSPALNQSRPGPSKSSSIQSE